MRYDNVSIADLAHVSLTTAPPRAVATPAVAAIA